MNSSCFDIRYFVMLSDDEISQLAASRNRDDFQPQFSLFLSTTRNLRGLRRLTFAPEDIVWDAPQFRKDARNNRVVVLDQANHIRGYCHTLPLPARPGEPQMRLSYDWFWSEFAAFLCRKHLFAFHDETSLFVMISAETTYSLQDEWQAFWNKLASKEFFERSVKVFLDMKSLFKKPASPWGSEHIPILSQAMAQGLIHYYQHGKRRNAHFKQQSIGKAISELEQLIEKGNYASIPLVNWQQAESYASGGDYFSGKKQIRCAGCGEIITAKEGYERLAIFIKHADERPQSANDKDKLPKYCQRCVATVFLCPVKLTPETLAVRFLRGHHDYADVSVQEALKKYVAQTLHVQSGSFINLHISEAIDRKSLAEIWGAYHYALWKIATIFPPELFAQRFEVEVYPGEETFRLPYWALWFISSFARWDEALRHNSCYTNDKHRIAFSRFLRLIAQKKIFQAFYTLISTNVIHDSYARTWKLNALQDIWSEFEQILYQFTDKEDKRMAIPDYPRIAGMTGLLLPLADRVQSAQKQPDEKRIAIKKLFEEVDRPVQYAYTAARETGSSDFIFCKRPNNRYFFEKALDLLAWAGEDVSQLKQEAEQRVAELVQKDERFAWMLQAQEKIFLCPDQIIRVVSALVHEGEHPPYKNEADWRAFAYQVKLALWSMFPQHLGAQD